MINQPNFRVEPWRLCEESLDLEVLAQSESVFALGNGHIGLRGNLDEGEPNALPGTYLNSVFEYRPLPYAEAGYGYPESGQTVVNTTNAKIIRLLVDDEPFDVRYGTLLSHQRVLDLRSGVLQRWVEWRSPAGAVIRVTSMRLVSLVQRSVVAVRYRVDAVSRPVRVVVQSELRANEEQGRRSEDPRVAAVLDSPFESLHHGCRGAFGLLEHRTKRSGLVLSAAVDHHWSAPGGVTVDAESSPDAAIVSFVGTLEPGRPLELTKFAAYGWSAHRSGPAVRDQVRAALTAASATGWDGLAGAQAEYLGRFWADTDVSIDGDRRVQFGVRFGIFQTLQAAARAERRPIPAKGLTGPGYDGHVFWDTEAYVLPLLTLTAPDAAADYLRWRHSTLPAARNRAAQLGLQGAAFPWRTINGQECSAYWPAGTAAFHINADVALALTRYVAATGDRRLERELGVEVLAETARLWLSLGHHDADGSFHIDGVTGPDEYSAVCDDNVYTNLMAAANMRSAAGAAARHPDVAAHLGITAAEMSRWTTAADAVHLPFDERLGVHPQAAGFTAHEPWAFATTPRDSYPLMLHYPYFQLYRHQVVKQADLVLAMQLFPDAFTDSEKAANFAYYEAITVRDSSLSAPMQAVMAAEVGCLDLAYDYLGEAALMDLWDINHDTRDGLHIAALAGAWWALVAGFGGLRMNDGVLRFAPRLPPAIRRLSFGLLFGTTRLSITVTPSFATYRSEGPSGLDLVHHGRPVTVPPGGRVRLAVPPPPPCPDVRQPVGRRPDPWGNTEG